MALIHVPRPRQSALDPDRPINALLKAQIEQLHEDEKTLQARCQTGIRVDAIQTEGEAAHYVRAVTEAIHIAGLELQRGQRMKGKRKRMIEIAAIADVPTTAGQKLEGKAGGQKKRKARTAGGRKT
jgi:hypothetical protein